MLRELGRRSQGSFAALRDPDELVVVQRFVRVPALGDPAPANAAAATPLDAEAMALLLRDARCLAMNPHANIGRVLHAEVSPAPRRELTIATELLDGSTLAELMSAAAKGRSDEPSLEIPVLARIALDVLAGLAALHALRDGIGLPLGAIHGALCPANIIVGKDGGTRIVDVLRRRPVRVGGRSEAFPYAAPEALAHGTADPRSDVYAVGAILSEALGARAASGPLAAIATRALSAEPVDRFAGPIEMAAELEAVMGAEVSSHANVAARVLELTGARIRMRRATLSPAASGTRRRASEQDIRDALGDADDDLLGPRASSPLMDLEAALALAARPAPPASPPRPAAPGPPVPEPATPRDFDIPIEVTETLNEAAPPRPRGSRWMVVAVVAMLVIGALVGWQLTGGLRLRSAPPAVAPPLATAIALPAPPAHALTNARSDSPVVPTAAQQRTTPSATTSARRAPPSPPPAPPSKPKKSVYEPDTF
jgi:serine/threonine protein kinase